MIAPPSHLRRALLEAAKIGLGVGLLGFLWHKGLIDPVQLVRSVGRHPAWMALAIGCQATLFLAQAARWKLVVETNRIGLPLGLSARLTLLSHFFSTCLPGNGAGDLVKGWIFARRGSDFGTVLGTMVLDRLMGLSGLFVAWSGFLIAAQYLHPAARGLLLPFLAVALATAGGLLSVVVFAHRLDAWLGRLAPPSSALFAKLLHLGRRIVGPVAKGATSKTMLAKALLLSLATQIAFLLTALVAGKILSIPVDLVSAGAVLPLVSLANALPLSPGGLGVGETVASTALGEFDMAPDAGAQIMLVVRMASVFWALVGGLCYLTLRPPEPRESPIEG